MKKTYMLVSLIDRDIDVSFYETHKEAKKQMITELIGTNDIDEELLLDENGKLKKEFDSGMEEDYQGKDFRYNSDSANLNSGHEIYSWEIFKVDKPYVLVTANSTEILDPDCFKTFDEARHVMLWCLNSALVINTDMLFNNDGTAKESGECLTGPVHYGFNEESCWLNEWLNCKIFHFEPAKHEKKQYGSKKDLWEIIARLADRMTNGMDTEEALEELSPAGLNDGMLIKLGFTEQDIKQFNEAKEEQEERK